MYNTPPSEYKVTIKDPIVVHLHGGYCWWVGRRMLHVNRIPCVHVSNSFIYQPSRGHIKTIYGGVFGQAMEVAILFLMKHQVSLDGLHVKSANLDDLFLKLTGHSLQA